MEGQGYIIKLSKKSGHNGTIVSIQEVFQLYFELKRITISFKM